MTQPDSASAPVPPFLRDPAPMLARIRGQWAGHQAGGGCHADLWIFGYASLIWRPDFESAEQRLARRARLAPRAEDVEPHQPRHARAPGPGVRAAARAAAARAWCYRVPHARGAEALAALWAREMPTGVYDPRWLRCRHRTGPVPALAFTLSRRSPNYTGDLQPKHVTRDLLRTPAGATARTLDYARQTFDGAAPAWHPRPQRSPACWTWPATEAARGTPPPGPCLY